MSDWGGGVCGSEPQTSELNGSNSGFIKSKAVRLVMVMEASHRVMPAFFWRRLAGPRLRIILNTVDYMGKLRRLKTGSRESLRHSFYSDVKNPRLHLLENVVWCNTRFDFFSYHTEVQFSIK